jgi:hypothetical protein
VNLVAVLIVSALIIVIWNSLAPALVFAALGMVWVGLTLRSAIEVSDDGFKVRGMLRSRYLRWSETDEFVVVGYYAPNRALLRSEIDYAAPTAEGPTVIGLSVDAVSAGALTARAPIFSVVAAVTSSGERVRVYGTASTPIDPAFPAQAAAELNRTLKRHNPSATAS